MQLAKILLPDGVYKEFEVNKNSEGEILFHQLTHNLSIEECEYFSLCFYDKQEGVRHWLYNDKLISKQIKGLPWEFSLEVKFYPTTPTTIVDDHARYFVFLQLRRDLLTGRLPVANVDTHALLGSFVAQMEFGDAPAEMNEAYEKFIVDSKLVPSAQATPETFQKIAHLHREHRGRTTAEAEIMFLDHCRHLPLYGIHIFKATDKDKKAVDIGIGAAGINIYQDDKTVRSFNWQNIVKIGYKRTYFSIKLKAGTLDEKSKDEKTLGYKLNSKMIAKAVRKLSFTALKFYNRKQFFDLAALPGMAMANTFEFFPLGTLLQLLVSSKAIRFCMELIGLRKKRRIDVSMCFCWCLKDFVVRITSEEHETVGKFEVSLLSPVMKKFFKRNDTEPGEDERLNYPAYFLQFLLKNFLIGNYEVRKGSNIEITNEIRLIDESGAKLKSIIWKEDEDVLIPIEILKLAAKASTVSLMGHVTSELQYEDLELFRSEHVEIVNADWISPRHMHLMTQVKRISLKRCGWSQEDLQMFIQFWLKCDNQWQKVVIQFESKNLELTADTMANHRFTKTSGYCTIFSAICGNGRNGQEIQIFHHKPFEATLSRHIAGLFRIDSGSEINKKYGYDTFEKLATLWREYGGLSGVQLLSGHILSDSKAKLDSQRAAYGNLVYNYRDLTEPELFGPTSLFDLPRNTSTHGIHYTAYTSEGLRFCPFLKKELMAKGVRFTQRRIENLEELGAEFDVVVNAAGLFGGVLAGDDAGNMTPIRGVLIRVDAPWHKHFLYRDFSTITIPVIDSVYMGTVKQEGAYGPPNVTFDDIQDITNRYVQLQPSFKRVHMLSSYVGYRPGRKQVRVEKQVREAFGTKKFVVVHNYGHGGNGFTLGYGSAVHAAHLVLNLPLDKYEGLIPKPLAVNTTIADWVHVLDN